MEYPEWSCDVQKWQSVFFQMRRNSDLVDENEVPGEMLSGKQVRILRLYNEIQGVVHGTNHRAQAASRKKEASAGQQGHATRLGRVAVPSDLPGQVSAAGQGQVAQHLVPPGRTIGYNVYTPPDKELNELSALQVVQESSPDRLILDPHATEIWENDWATHTEVSDELEERLERLAEQLTDVKGADKTGIQFVLQTSQLEPEYVGLFADWRKENGF